MLGALGLRRLIFMTSAFKVLVSYAVLHKNIYYIAF